MRESTPLADISVDFQICVYCFWKAGDEGKGQAIDNFLCSRKPG